MARARGLTLDEGERHVVEIRPHPWQVIRPALWLLPLAAALPVYSYVDVQEPQLRLTSFSPLFIAVLAAVAVAYLLKLLIVDLLPWSQQVYILTNRRVIVKAGVLSLYRQECSLLKVEESDYASRGLIARLLDVGDVQVMTSGPHGDLVLRAVPRPRRIQEVIGAQVRAASDEETRRRMAEEPREIVRHLQLAMDGVAPADLALTEPIRPLSKAAIRVQQRLNLLPDEAVALATHQHPLVLVAGLMGPFFGLCFVAAVLTLFGLVFLPYALAVTALVLAPWAAWRTIAYLSHEYVITTDRLMELRSLPLFYQTRDVVQLEGVQDITLDIPSWIRRVADTGDVIVELSGAAESVVIKTVARPAAIQALLFETMEARQRNRRAREDEQLMSTLGHWFGEYHKLQWQRERLERRLPSLPPGRSNGSTPTASAPDPREPTWQPRGRTRPRPRPKP